MRRISFALALLAATAAARAGVYTEAGIASASPSIVGWATGFQNLTRGAINLSNPAAGLASYGAGSDALGAPTGSNADVVTLGDGGSITLTFDRPIANGSGADFAVFENGFASGDRLFAELAFVEVSSDGTTFARFPSVSLTPTDTQVGAFGTLDPTDVHNLAGKDEIGTGTLFDLTDVVGAAGVNVNAIRYVRVVDVVGSIDPQYGTRDSLGHLINDPFTTPFSTGGFDLDAVGVLNVAAAPEPGSLAALAGVGLLSLRRRR